MGMARCFLAELHHESEAQGWVEQGGSQLPGKLGQEKREKEARQNAAGTLSDDRVLWLLAEEAIWGPC